MARLWSAVQVPEELEMFVDWLLLQDIQSVLEIGTLNGGTAAMFLALGYRVVSIDLPDGPYGGFQRPLCELRNQQLRVFRGFTGILGNSRDPTIVAEATALGPYDLVFIDGDHTVQGIFADLEHYRPLGRYVALHDITREHDSYGVPAAWRSLLDARKVECIHRPAGWGGIGIAW